MAVLGCAVFIVAMALIFGSTMTLRPRDGIQPIEFQDVAFYSVLGADLARTGTETIYAPSGFAQLEGLPVQTWYHWGEVWLASAVISVFGMAPLDARHFVVLPLLLLTAAALTGTLVRRVTGTPSRGAFLFGFLACLFLAPMPLFPGEYFNLWHASLVFGITAYGLAAVAGLLALYCLAGLGDRRATWALATFVGSAAALILPAHIAIAVLALVGVGSVWTIRIAQSLAATRRLPVVARVWRRTFIATGIAIVATVAWGLLTGHGVGGSGLSPSVTPFNAAWREAIATTILGAGALLAIAAAWLKVRKSTSIEADLYLGTAALVVIGALGWGWRLADFNMFHLSTAGVSVFATPAAAVAVWSIWLRSRRTGHTSLGVAVLVLCALQLGFGAAVSIVRLQGFATRETPPVPVAILEAIRSLPREAKLAYACNTADEIAFWDAQLLGLDARTGRRIVPMCFQADFFGQAMGDPSSANIASPLFRWAPQRGALPGSECRSVVGECGRVPEGAWHRLHLRGPQASELARAWCDPDLDEWPDTGAPPPLRRVLGPEALRQTAVATSDGLTTRAPSS